MRTPRPTLFPYTTLFRSPQHGPVGVAEPVPDGRSQVQAQRTRQSVHARLRDDAEDLAIQDRKSTRLNSSHVSISYAVFCLKKKNINYTKNIRILPPHKTT